MGDGSSQGAMQRHRLLFILIALAAIASVGVIASGGLARGAHSASTTTDSPGTETPVAQKKPATRLTALPPKTIVDATAPLRVRLSGPPAPGSPRPMLTPSVAGSWSTVGDSEYFTPVSTLEPCSSYTLTIWSGTTATGHSSFGKRRFIPLQVDCPPTSGLQQTLAALGYIPAKFHSLYGIKVHEGPETRVVAARRAYRPLHGRLAPDPSDAPAVSMGEMEAVTKGALEVFQAARGLEATGEPDRATWASLLAARTLYRRIANPYTWVSVSEALPETLEVHRGDRVVLTTPANTGVPGAETETGTFAIYARYLSTTMTGTDPDGVKYVAPDVPWVNYFNGGDAVHGYPRESYGFPQSNGCVELPIETAETVYGMLQIGDIVQVG